MNLLKKLFKTPSYLHALFFVVLIRILRPIVLIRCGSLYSFRIGHFAANTELYLCELRSDINRKSKNTIDIFYLNKPISNSQLVELWKRILVVFPSWFVRPIHMLNNKIPGGEIHDIGTNTNMDRDVHNLLDKYPGHLKFSKAEEKRGLELLNLMGLPSEVKFVCLLVRDSTYLNFHQPELDHSGHSYRDANIQDYRLVSEELAKQGFFVIRMGAKVKQPLKCKHPRVIDYATSLFRSDFMDIYLGAKCEFCISTASGWDAVPGWLFRKPIVFTNVAPLGYIPTFSNKFLIIPKKYIDKKTKRMLTLSEIFSNDAAFCLETSGFDKDGIELVDNTPGEILEVVDEMVMRLQGNWAPQEMDIELQKKFWEIFPKDSISFYNGKKLHGEIYASIGANYLRKNQNWIH